MAGTWLLLLLALGCPALPTGMRGTPFPSLAPPITLLVDGKQQTLVVCLVFDVAPPGLESSIWFSAGNGSALDAFTYGPSPAADGTWTSLAQLSLPSEELAAWETLVCHTGPGAGDHSWSTQPLQLSGEASAARTCLWEPLRGTPGQALLLGVLRLLLFKLLLLDLLLTCGRLRAPPAARATRPGRLARGTPGWPRRALPRGPTALSSRSPRGGESPPSPATGLASVMGAPQAQGSPCPSRQRRSLEAAAGFTPSVRGGIPGAQAGRRGRSLPAKFGPGARAPPAALLPPAAGPLYVPFPSSDRSFLGAGRQLPLSPCSARGFLREKAPSLRQTGGALRAVIHPGPWASEVQRTVAIKGEFK